MRKEILTILAVTFCMAFTLIPANNNRIAWIPAIQLSWNDFKGTPENNTVELAATDYSILYTLHAFSQGMTITLKCAFNIKSSWTKDTTDEFLLSHELGHFNLAEVYARKIRKDLSSQSFKYDSATNQFKKVYNKYYTLLNKQQDAYDFATNFSKNHIVQKLWTARIDSMLHSLDSYRDTVLHLSIQ